MKLLFLLSVFLTATSGISQAESFRKSKMIDAKGKEQTVMLDFESQDRRLTVKGEITRAMNQMEVGQSLSIDSVTNMRGMDMKLGAVRVYAYKKFPGKLFATSMAKDGPLIITRTA